MNIKAFAVSGLLLAVLAGVACSSAPGFEARVDSAVKPYRFSIAAWQCRTLGEQLAPQQDKEIDAGVEEVLEYFALVERIKAAGNGGGSGSAGHIEAELARLQERRDALAGAVEAVIKKQVSETLVRQGISHPLDRYIKLDGIFPPPNFKLEELPHLLVISPRERIKTIRTTLLEPDITVPQMEEVEAEVDALGVSSLVDALGGLGATYPTMVTNGASLRFVIDTAAHEWAHQYLVFRPLGFRYLLDITGIAPDYEIATMNETVADIVGEEISNSVIKKYYPDYQKNSPPAAEPVFDFGGEMREIRKAVDLYLAQGEVEAAEKFMEEKRQYLEDNGYYIRKLNQAYFAFHGKYSDRPAFISPIGLELKELRSKSASLKEFLDTVAGMTGRQDLKLALEKAS